MRPLCSTSVTTAVVPSSRLPTSRPSWRAVRASHSTVARRTPSPSKRTESKHDSDWLVPVGYGLAGEYVPVGDILVVENVIAHHRDLAGFDRGLTRSALT